MDGMKLRGCFVALVTPFTKELALDEQALKKLVEWQISEGINGIVACGTTGESVTLNFEEYQRVLEVIVQQVAGRVPVICGAGANDTQKTIKMAQIVEQVGGDAILSVTPYYNKPPQQGLYEHFKALADAVAKPIILYNVPGRTSVNLTAETTLRLAEISNIVGVKEASGDFTQIMNIIKGRPEGFTVLSGDDALSLPMIATGADGVISVVANQIPRDFTALITAALDGRYEKARQLQYKYLNLMNINFIEANPIPVKTALAMMGRIQESLRLPLTTMQAHTRAQLETELRQLELI